MKKLIILAIPLFLLTGCMKSNDMEDIEIYTSVYPIEYVTNYLYANHAKEINSIYPDGIIVGNYSLTEKQISDYSTANLFVYSGLSNEINYAASMINLNNNLKLIDASMGMEVENTYEELWLNPSNLLMITQNIKEGLETYIENPYVEKDINDKYEELKISLSELDAELKLTSENATTNTIITSSDLFKFLEKYGIQVISLEENENLTDKTVADAKNLIKNGTAEYIFLKKYEEPSETVKDVLSVGGSTLVFNTLEGMTEDERDAKEDYITIMNKNIDLLKKELYQ